LETQKTNIVSIVFSYININLMCNSANPLISILRHFDRLSSGRLSASHLQISKLEYWHINTFAHFDTSTGSVQADSVHCISKLSHYHISTLAHWLIN